MALQYHPDTNDNPFAHSRFREIQEAYEVLSHPQSRSSYNREWRLHFPAQPAPAVREHTPASILSDIATLQQKVLKMDRFRFNKDGAFLQLMELLSEDNIMLLRQEAPPAIKEKIISAVMTTGARLNTGHILSLSGKLLSLADAGAPLYSGILTWQKEAKQQALWDKYKPLLALLIALALCVLIYLLT